ncbi:hypothetical protein [Antarcticirhabdus aurantiaca]|uniref:Uncharacterized protein n=1 Tax=Antarcticirhabdus aurantiaca TaxID=2606717 RepID=A0ACD4NRM0_9HYPH|nr:hypothetical protein OXU80_03475 [Jeongeuplla avenae]
MSRKPFLASHHPIGPATPSAGPTSAVFLPRAETPAPHHPRSGAGTLSLLDAVTGRRQPHPLVAEVRDGAPRAFFVHARRMPDVPKRRNVIRHHLEGAALESLRLCGAALMVLAAIGIVVGLSGSQPSDVVILQAEVER